MSSSSVLSAVVPVSAAKALVAGRATHMVVAMAREMPVAMTFWILRITSILSLELRGRRVRKPRQPPRRLCTLLGLDFFENSFLGNYSLMSNVLTCDFFIVRVDILEFDEDN